jgi:cell division septation protein DedD
MKFKEIYGTIFVIFVFIAGCNSGEYDLDEYQFQNTERSLKYDSSQIANKENEEKQEAREELLSSVTYTYIVQIGAFANQDNFERFFEKAKSTLGDRVYYAYINELYKIRIGDFSNKSEALDYRQMVIGLGYYDAFIIAVRK